MMRSSLGAGRDGKWNAAGLVVGGLAVSFLWLLLFHDVVVNAGAPWERGFLISLHHGVTPAIWSAAFNISRVGYAPIIVPVMLLFLAWWLIRRQGWKAALFLAAFAVLTVLDYAGKPFFDRPRPDLFPRPAIGGASYPSGHALFAVGFYGVIAYLVLISATPLTRRIGWVVWTLFAAAVGFSRLILGVHWPTDILAGYIAGGIVLLSIGTARRSARLGEASAGMGRDLARWPSTPTSPAPEVSLRPALKR